MTKQEKSLDEKKAELVQLGLWPVVVDLLKKYQKASEEADRYYEILGETRPKAICTVCDNGNEELFSIDEFDQFEEDEITKIKATLTEREAEAWEGYNQVTQEANNAEAALHAIDYGYDFLNYTYSAKLLLGLHF